MWHGIMELKSHDFNEGTVDQLLKEELTHKFVNVLEDARCL